MIKRPSASLLAMAKYPAIAMLFMFSCVEHETPEPTPPKPDPNNPLPIELCHSHITEGYTDKLSYYPDEKVAIFLNGSTIVSCRLDVYDISGKIAFSVASPLAPQAKQTDPSVNGFGFSPTVTIDIPANTKSGMYFIDNSIPFLVKTKANVDLVVVYPSNTVNAYCTTGGRSLYDVNDKPVAISFLRPMAIQSFSKQCMSWFYNIDVNVGFIADSDLDNYVSIENAKILAVVGHNEYWTRKARNNFDKFVNEGKHALILSGNTMWWQVRYSNDEHKQLICYKAKQDPISDPELATVNWDNPNLNYSIIASIGADFTHGGYGLKSDNGWNGFKVVSPDSPLLEGSGLKLGDVISVPTVEFDGAPISGFDGDMPLLDADAINAYRVELIGFDKGFRVKETYGTFIVLQKTAKSGIIVNTCSTDWCSDSGMGGSSGAAIKKITRNAIDKLLNKKEIFSPKASKLMEIGA